MILIENILYYICGFIVRKLFKMLDCSTCKSALINVDQNSDHNYCGPTNESYKNLVESKNRGGLIFSAYDVLIIIKEYETYIIRQINNIKLIKYSKIILKVQHKLIECVIRFLII